MDVAASPIPQPRALSSLLHFDRQAIGAWTLGFAPVLYLALRGGGYDLVIRSEVGLAAAWIVLIGALIGILPTVQIGRLAWVCIGAFTAFVLWSLIASSWSLSAERTIIEVGRLAAYAAFLLLGVAVVRRDTIRPLVTGVGAAFGVVALLAVLSRLHPSWFPTDQVAIFFPGSNARLSYPLNYASGTGNFLAMGIPLLLLLATRARTIAGQAVAAAAVPIAVLGVVLTASRGGVLTAIAGIAVFYALAPDRIPKLLTGLLTAAGSMILVIALLDRHAVRDGLSTPLAITQRHEMLVLLAAVSVGVALTQVGIGLATRYAVRPRWLQPSYRRLEKGAAMVAAVVVALVVAIAAGVPGKLSQQWREFKQTDTTRVVSTNVYNRLGSVAGSHRYQYWRAAAKAFDKKPLTGIGPGTFEYWWDQHGSIHEFIRNAHSLYVETLAETGIIGLLLLAAFLLGVLAAGVWRAMRAPPLARTILAGATAAFAAFLVSAAYDWMWQLAVAPVAAILLGAAILAYQEQRPRDTHARLAKWAPRVTAAVLAAAAIVAIGVPFGATAALRSSQADAGAGRYRAALNDAETAQQLEPFAASPRLQRALILERTGDLRGALTAIDQATAREAVNWRLWLVRARIEAEGGHAAAAVRDYRHAHDLDPRSAATAE